MTEFHIDERVIEPITLIANTLLKKKCVEYTVKDVDVKYILEAAYLFTGLVEKARKEQKKCATTTNT